MIFFEPSIVKTLLLPVLRSGQVRVQIHHSSCDIVSVHSSQILWQSKHRGQSLLAEFSVLPSSKSVSDKVRGSVGV